VTSRSTPASISTGGDGTIQRLSTTPTAAQETKSRVRKFWEDEPCGSIHGEAAEGTREYFDQIEQRRAQLEPFIPTFADFAGSRGESVLEIGVGVGTDFVNFARAEAKVTGIDLTEHGVELVRRRLALEGLEGDVRVADAESLPFEDASFDRVYSWGVLHHTPDTERAVREAIRVLRPGGDLCVMLYSRHSWVAYGLWLKFALLRGRPWLSLADILGRHMESEGTKGFTKRELRAMFGQLENLRVEKVGTPYDRRFAGPVARLTGPWLGWFSVIRGTKPRV
jgi:ubiquinone/menaquinone biosynthesis C-methylase UbiE